MVGETVDSILLKEGKVETGVEITFLSHSICLISQCCFYQHIMISYTLNIYAFLLAYGKFGFDLKKLLNP